MDTEVLRFTTGSNAVTDLTEKAAAYVQGRGDGLLHLFAPHATAGLALFEVGSGSDHDLGDLLARTFPRDDRYRHQHGSPGHGADHLLPIFVSPSLMIPVFNGALALGTWQSITFIDTNADNPTRQVRLSFIEG
jgi:secondary thiamine-phosphate synthase enzyme